MSGKYCGMQALIKEQNDLCIYVPCCAHSLNLVGKAAANTCSAAVKFFDFVQEVHVFFTASPSRYQILTEALSSYIHCFRMRYWSDSMPQTRYSGVLKWYCSLQ